MVMVVIQLGIPKTKSDISEEKRSLTFESYLDWCPLLLCLFGFGAAEERRLSITAEEERHRVITSAIAVMHHYRMAAILEKIHFKHCKYI